MWARLTVALLMCACISLRVSAQQTSSPQDASTPAKPDVAAGKRNFERHCALCHGIDGGGGRGPNLHRARLVHAPDDNALKSVISDGIPPEMPPAWFLSEEEVASVAAYVRSLSSVPSEPLPGDAKKGQTIFSKSRCEGCHILGQQGNGYGPSLTDIGARRSAIHIRQAIAAPASALPEGFLFVRAVTKTGEAILGIRLNEDTFSIQLKDATGRLYSFRKSELKELNKLRGQSPMPPYSQMLQPTEIDDLVAYLASQKGEQ
jgi:cytochrome c oxidase cbb3-type subunit III